MKAIIQISLLLTAFLSITACGLVTPAPAYPTPTMQEDVLPTEMTDEELIRTALAAHLALKWDDLTIVIEQYTGTHARCNTEEGNFLAAKVSGEWQIVADGQTLTDCQAVDEYGFPSDMVPECSNVTQASDEDALGAVLAAHLGVNLEDLSINIEENTGTHAIGGVENGFFLAVKVDGIWQIVADGQVMPDCQIVQEYGFPAEMIPECSNPTPTSDEAAIRTALSAYLGVNLKNLSISIDQNTGTHARGAVDNGYFLAAKVDGDWEIVADGQAMPDCDVVSEFNFPPAMVPECENLTVNQALCFKPGGTYTFVQNLISAGEQHTYTLQAMVDQTMIVSVASSNKDVFMGIEGLQDGIIYLTTNEQTDSWTGTL